MPRVHATFLGTGDAFSAAGSFQASYLVRAPGTTVLLDCGSGTLTSLKRHRIDAAPIDLVLLSHLHGDHFAGLPFLFLEYTYEQPRQRPLTIAGPPGTEERVRALYSAAYKELAAHPLPFPLVFTEMRPEQPVRFGDLTVEPFRVPHQESETSLGLRATLAGRTVLYRIAQEALTNVVKHAQASQVHVTIQKLSKALRMEITDNGRGFEVERVLFAKRHKRLGVLGMRERVHMVGGRFNIESKPGQGTTIRAQIPIRNGTRGGRLKRR